MGLIYQLQERSILYRRYVTLHGLITCAIFSVAAVWIIISATRHTSAKTKCIASFFSGNLSGSSEGDTLCNIFAWVDVGIMGGLWVILAILQVFIASYVFYRLLNSFQAYLYAVMSSYGSSQRRDHDKYDQLDPSQPLTGSTSIPLHDRADPWDSRPSTDSLQVPMNGGNQYTHVRQVSTISASDVLSEPHQQPKDSLSNAEYGHRPSLYRPYSDGHGSEQLSYPSYAYTYEPSPTPVAGNYYDNETAQTERPRQAQTHPGESA